MVSYLGESDVQPKSGFRTSHDVDKGALLPQQLLTYRLTVTDIHTTHVPISLSLANEQGLLPDYDGLSVGVGQHPNHRVVSAVPVGQV
jgi:hypothetical protein